MGTAGNVEVFEKMPVAKAVSSMAVPTVIGQLIILFLQYGGHIFRGADQQSVHGGGRVPHSAGL